MSWAGRAGQRTGPEVGCRFCAQSPDQRETEGPRRGVWG